MFPTAEDAEIADLECIYSKHDGIMTFFITQDN